MRLLNAKTLELTQFNGAVPPYAILSHTWGAEEVTFQNLTSPDRDKKRGFAKILGCCRQALTDTLKWVWVDTCCIDKTSSAELSEAINSMFAWYRDSQVCYVHLEDVIGPPPGFPESQFRAARWFTRGWCLQELIAPRSLEFYTADWRDIGSKFSLCDLIEDITAVPRRVLLGRNGAIHECSIAQKMSWASQRQTTRVEDEAYCLLGIFGVNMPMLYGEGQQAFYRLQEEIIRHTEDASFLLWTRKDETGSPSWGRLVPVCAPRPACFHPLGPLDAELQQLDYDGIQKGGPLSQLEPAGRPSRGDTPSELPSRPAQITSRGLRIFLFNTHFPDQGSRLVWTGFTYQGRLVCLKLIRATRDGPERYCRFSFGISDLHLVEPAKTSGFQLSEMYLVMRNTGDCLDSYSCLNDQSKSRMPGPLHIVLSSSEKTAVTMGPSTPPLCILYNPPGDPTAVTEPPRVYGGRTQTWRTGIMEPYLHARRDLTSRYLPMSIIFWLDLDQKRTHAGDGGSSLQQALEVCIHLAQRWDVASTCTITPVTQYVVGIVPPQPWDSASDRAEYVLKNGDVAVASIKPVLQGNGERLHILRVAVLPGQDGPV